MKKAALLTISLLVVLGIAAFQWAKNLQNDIFPPQAAVLTLDDSRCALDSLPQLRNVSLQSVTLSDDQATHCKILGTIETEINFELLLPNAWNGKFAMGGGGGFVGEVVNIAALYGAISSGYATVGTDTGHSAHPIDASWALNNPQRLEDFGHRAVHLTATTAKTLIEAYYQRSSAQDYFIGCSRGGGQALVEAQRYPQDFDGIVAGAPAYDWPALAANGVQINQKMFPDPSRLEQAVIGQPEQALIAKRYLAQCDADDGIEDGFLSDPPQCSFAIESLRCADDKNENCLDNAQIAVMQQIYNGAQDAQGQIYPGYPLGGELGEDGMSFWLAGGVEVNPEISQPRSEGGSAAPVMPNASYGFSTGIMKNMIFNDAQWDYSTYDFVEFRKDSAHAASILNASDPDLSEFRERGGKLLMYHGWSDRALSAHSTIDYFEKIIELDPSAEQDVRLYMLPGVGHCFGGEGPSLVNYLTAIDQWVTSNEPPQQLTAQWLRMGAVPWGSRLICPYPQQAIYDGTGDTQDDSSFRCE